MRSYQYPFSSGYENGVGPT